ncbi:hypothetical protein [Brevundimonas sp. A19_0]|uniref:hypothetical protein n=1 Tax=Brevundimonas sp. A19_0 TaxID=2821087 RepID=UPI001ADA5E05|nr:hypothetical protein [Brevundimonas sp. A19_0]MBO9501599.1 hypothetical protein [Brevundimonas sp. A19_0]
MSLPPQTSLTHQSQIASTDEAFGEILHFLFGPNSILTTIHLAILVSGLVFAIWVYRINPQNLRSDFPCREFATAIVASVKESVSAFLTMFLIGGAMFYIAVALDGDELPSKMVQLLTYAPIIVLALSQFRALFKGVQTIKHHTGL